MIHPTEFKLKLEVIAKMNEIKLLELVITQPILLTNKCYIKLRVAIYKRFCELECMNNE